MPPPTAESRLQFLDALRGAALVLMVLNHTGRWWQDGSMGWPRYYLIYVSMTLAAPLFLFLVGFCLPLSSARHGGRPAAATAWRYVRRGAQIILAGLVLNLLVFREDPVYSNGVLQTIGLSIVLSAPWLLVLGRAWARATLLLSSAALYLAFAWSVPALERWLPAHPVAGRIWFFEFPPWPWLALVWVGLVLGWGWATLAGGRERAWYAALLGAAGALCLAAFFAWDWWAQSPSRWMFTRDFLLNRHWTPRGATILWCAGSVLALLALFYWAVEARRWRAPWLVTLGRTALVLYFTHHLIVLTAVNQLLGLRFNDWWLFALTNLLLLALLVWMGWAWLRLKRWWQERRWLDRGLPLLRPGS